MAKQFGVGDEAMAGLLEPAHHSFPPDQKAAIELADAMTKGSGAIPDDLFERIAQHFDEAQIVEIAAVIGLFNYFNRFNNMLRTEITLIEPDVLIHRVEEALPRAGDRTEAARDAVSILAHGRRYPSLMLCRVKGERLDPIALGGHPAERSGRVAPQSLPATLIARESTRIISVPEDDPGYGPVDPATRSACIVSIRKGGAVVGALIAEQDRRDAFTVEDAEDRRLLERAAGILGRLL